MAETVNLIISPHCDLDHENSKLIFSLAHDEASPYQVWLLKILQLRRYAPDENSVKYSTFAVTLTLSTTQLAIFS